MLKAINLKCGYLENPLGIGELKPRFSWVLDSDERNVLQESYIIQVAKDENNFSNPLWDSGRVVSDNSIHVEYNGPKLTSRSLYYFRVKVTDNMSNESPWSEASSFETGILDQNEWLADFITSESSEAPEFSSAGPLFRKEFEVNGKITSARIYVTSLGLYELRLNGQRVGDDLLTPGWTSYNKRLQYQTMDVTHMLNQNANALGVMLGNGWYKGYLAGWTDNNREKYGKRTALLLQLHIRYSDGKEQVILSDRSWKSSMGPILMSELYNGESYDARLEVPDWDKPGFDDSSWNPVYTVDVNKGILTAQENVPVKKIEYIKPLTMFNTPKGETVIDMGQNMVGWVQFTVRGSEGSRAVLKHAEILDSDGNFYTENLRSAKQTIEYILKGKGDECFEPHFTFQGFRYVKLEEWPCEPKLSDFTGVVIHSSMKQTGKFQCSNHMINQLQHNILWGQKGNFVDVPTDCPQRDERLGWTGDAQVFARTACFNMNTAPFFKKWLRDMKADQAPDGGVPHVIPNVLGANEHSACGWADAAVICPWTVYQCFGDISVLEEQYDSMKAWVECIRGHAENGLLWNTGFHFGDWLALDAKEGSYLGSTPNDLCATAFYAYSVSLLAKSAEVLNKNEDARNYTELHEQIVQKFQEEFFTPSGRLAAPTQTAHVLALMFNLVKEKDRKRTVDTLVKHLEENKWHLSTGFLGTPYLCHVLSSNGRADIAYKLLLQTDYPSWLYQVSRGATTIWEHWDGLKPDNTFWSADMNSFNHYAYGAVGDWLYRVVAGLDTDERKPGYKHMIIKPTPSRELQWAAVEYESMYGLIKTKWQIADNNISLEVQIPHNTTASVILPVAGISAVAGDADAVMSYSSEPNDEGSKKELVLELGSGSYSFSYPFESDK